MHKGANAATSTVNFQQLLICTKQFYPGKKSCRAAIHQLLLTSPWTHSFFSATHWPSRSSAEKAMAARKGDTVPALQRPSIFFSWVFSPLCTVQHKEEHKALCKLYWVFEPPDVANSFHVNAHYGLEPKSIEVNWKIIIDFKGLLIRTYALPSRGKNHIPKHGRSLKRFWAWFSKWWAGFWSWWPWVYSSLALLT